MRRAGSAGLVAVCVAACLAVWLLPAPKPNAVVGRLDYAQFVLALVGSALCLSIAGVALCPVRVRRAVGFRVTSLWVGVLVAVGAWEVAARLLPAPSPMDNPWYLSTDRGVEASAELPYERPRHLEWEGMSQGDLATMRGDEDPDARRVRFETDFEGFRNSSDLRRAEIVFLGDSFTEAGNVPEAETFVRRVGEALGVSVRNLGRAGYTPPSELLVLQKYGLRNQPRQVVWQVAESNDLNEAALFARWRSARVPYFEMPEARAVAAMLRPEALRGAAARSPTHRLFERLKRKAPWPLAGDFRDAAGRVHRIRFLPARPIDPTSHPGWPLFGKSLQRGAELLRERDIGLLVLMVPTKIRVMGPYVAFVDGDRRELWDQASEQTLAFALRRLCDELGIRFVDATARLRALAAAGQLAYLPFDTHLAPPGHRAVGELVVDELAALRDAPGGAAP